MPASDVPHMSPDEFRRQGHQAVDLIADYWRDVESMPVLCPLRPGEVAGRLPEHPPKRGEPWTNILGDIQRVVIPGLTHWQSPNFFAYFPANGSFPAIIGDLISTGLGVQGMLWATSPACTEVETRVLDWLVGMLGLPARFLSTGSGGGVIHGTASEAVLTALVAARHRNQNQSRGAQAPGRTSVDIARTPDNRRLAPLGSDHTIYASTQAHSSVIKAAMVAGLASSPEDRTHIRLIGTDADYAMRPDLLRQAIEDDIAAGRTPLFVCATIGTTSSTAVDPVDQIAPICREHGAWLHVDAAFSGSALLCEEHRWMSRGVELADSFCFNPHKWMLTSFDCSCFWVADRAALTSSLSITPEYLRNAATQSGQVIDYRDWQIPLGRRFRALKLWMVIRHYGVEGLRAYIREHVRLAAMFEALVRSDERFEVVTPRTVSLVCFRLRPRSGTGLAPGAGGPQGHRPEGRCHDETPTQTDARNKELLDALNASGKLYLTHTNLPAINPDGSTGHGRYVLRMAIGASQTEETHVRAAWDAIRSHSL